MKEMTSQADVLMSEEEKADMQGATSILTPPGTGPTGSPVPDPLAAHRPNSPAVSTTLPTTAPTTSSEVATTTGLSTPPTSGKPSTSSTDLRSKEKDKDKKRPRVSPEQRQKLQEMEMERRKAMEDRVNTLTRKLNDRMQPFVDAKNAGDNSDPETQAFHTKMKKEAEELKFESFGVEV